MQDKLLETLGGLTDMAAKLEKQMLPLIPHLTEIQNNAENVGPEVMKIYNDQMRKIKSGRYELDQVKENLKKFKA